MKYFKRAEVDKIIDMLWNLYVPYLEDIGALPFCSKTDLEVVLRDQSFNTPSDIIKAIDKRLKPARVLGKLAQHGGGPLKALQT